MAPTVGVPLSFRALKFLAAVSFDHIPKFCLPSGLLSDGETGEHFEDLSGAPSYATNGFTQRIFLMINHFITNTLSVPPTVTPSPSPSYLTAGRIAILSGPPPLSPAGCADRRSARPHLSDGGSAEEEGGGLGPCEGGPARSGKCQLEMTCA